MRHGGRNRCTGGPSTAATPSMALAVLVVRGWPISAADRPATGRCVALPDQERSSAATLTCTGGLSCQCSHSAAKSSRLSRSMCSKVQPVAVARQA